MPFDNPNQNPFGDIERLGDARDWISDKANWVQNRYRDGSRRCLVAALSAAAGSTDVHTPNRAERRLARLLAAQLPETVPVWVRLRFVTARQRLIWYNDCPSTSHDDVLALIDRAISRVAVRAPG